MNAKKSKPKALVVTRPRAVAASSKPVLKVQPNERKAKVVAALKRLHPMD